MLDILMLVILVILLTVLAVLVWKLFPTAEEIVDFVFNLPRLIVEAIIAFFKWLFSLPTAKGVEEKLVEASKEMEELWGAP